jgi:hypothetical protein
MPLTRLPASRESSTLRDLFRRSSHDACRRLATLVCAAGLVVVPATLLAQVPVRVTIPAAAFSAEGASARVTVTDGPGGRRFRGPAFSKVVLRAVLQMPPSASAEPRMQRLVVHFRTSASGPSLRSVEVRNGSNVAFRIETNLSGDYLARDTSAPAASANVWAVGPVSVGTQSVLRLEIQFPGGFDSQVDPGEFVIGSVGTDFVRKPAALPTSIPSADVIISSGAGGPGGARGGASPPSIPLAVASGVLYTRTAANQLMWYGHTGREDGTFRWAAANGRAVGTGWDFKQIMSGGDGVIYAITQAGDLMWYRHTGRADGTFRWASSTGARVGTGWNFDHVFAAGGGVIYAITSSGDLLWFRHDGRADGTARWAAPTGKTVGTGWVVAHAFAADDGVIYAVMPDGDLVWNRHDGRGNGSVSWAAPSGKKVGSGWTVTQAFSGGKGIIYAVLPNGDLQWNRHDGRADGTPRWAAPQGKKVGSGWTLPSVFSGDALIP